MEITKEFFGFGGGFDIFLLRDGIHNDTAAGIEGEFARVGIVIGGSDGNRGIHIVFVVNYYKTAAVGVAMVRFKPGDVLHGRKLGAAGNRSARESIPEEIEDSPLPLQRPDNIGIHLDQLIDDKCRFVVFDFDTAGFAVVADVVSDHVDDHGKLGRFFG